MHRVIKIQKNVFLPDFQVFNIYLTLLLMAVSILFPDFSVAQSKVTATDKAILVNKIVNSVDWQLHREDVSTKFQIIILGKDKVLQTQMTKFVSKGAAPIEVLLLDKLDNFSNYSPQVIYFTNQAFSILPNLFKISANKKILFISDNYNKEQYVMFNLVSNGSKLDYRVNDFNLYKHHLILNVEQLNVSNKIIDLNELLNKLTIKLQSKDKELSEKLDELEMQGFEVESQNKKLNAKKKEVLMQQMALNSQKESLTFLLKEVNEKEKILVNKEQTLQDNTYLLENQKIILAQKEYLLKIKNDENTKQKAELEFKEAQLKAKMDTILLKNTTIGTQSGRIEKQRSLIWGGIGSLILFAFMIFFIYRGYRIKQKTNKQLEEKQEEIHQQAEELMASNNALNQQKDILEEKNSEIKASLNYALTIQQSILPNDEFLATKLNYFHIYKPKDIVSGDFYWFSEINEKGVNYKFIAVSDCTGHGVPGAFMSLIGSRILDEIIETNRVINTKDILENLHQEIVKALKQDKTDNSDGMDITLVRLSSGERNETKMQYTAAKHSIFVCRSGEKEIEKFRGDQKGIGGNYFDHVMFTSNELTLFPNDIIYLLSDGIPDQCSLARKKFKGTSMTAMLKKAVELPFEKQKECLLSDIKKFMSYEDQIDDLTLFSVKI